MFLIPGGAVTVFGLEFAYHIITKSKCSPSYSLVCAAAGILFAGGAYHPAFCVASGLWGMKSSYANYKKPTSSYVVKNDNPYETHLKNAEKILLLLAGTGSLALTAYGVSQLGRRYIN